MMNSSESERLDNQEDAHEYLHAATEVLTRLFGETKRSHLAAYHSLPCSMQKELKTQLLERGTFQPEELEGGEEPDTGT